MARKYLEEKTPSNDIPWCNDYLKKGGNIDDVCVITEIIYASSGNLILVGTDFKGCLFKGSKILDFVVEALEYWISDIESYAPIAYLEAKAGGKVAFFVEEEELKATWKQLQNGYHQSLSNGNPKLEKLLENPFLKNKTAQKPSLESVPQPQNTNGKKPPKNSKESHLERATTAVDPS